MVAQIDDLAVELLEFVLQHLDFEDICHVRLVCKRLSVAANLGLVKSDFGTREVALHDLEQLQTLKDQVTRGWKSCRLTGLTVFGLVSVSTNDLFQDVDYDDDHDVDVDVGFNFTAYWNELEHHSAGKKGSEARDPPAGAQTLLAELFTAIRLNGRDGMLDLRLDVRGRLLNGEIVSSNRIYHWRWNLAVASEVYKIAMNALVTSHLAVKRLNMFGDTLRCGLAADDIATIEACRLESLTHISVCLLGSYSSFVGITVEQNPPFALKESSIISLIARSPSLTSLDVRLYSMPLIPVPRTTQDWFREFLSSALQEPKSNLRNLQHLSLRGVAMGAAHLDELSTLLPALRNLRLEGVTIGYIVETTDTTFNLPNPARFPLLERFEAYEIHMCGTQVVFGATDSPEFPADAESWREHRTPFDMVWIPGRSSGPIQCTTAYQQPNRSPHWLPYLRACNDLHGPPNMNFGQSTPRRQILM